MPFLVKLLLATAVALAALAAAAVVLARGARGGVAAGTGGGAGGAGGADGADGAGGAAGAGGADRGASRPERVGGVVSGRSPARVDAGVPASPCSSTRRWVTA